MATASVARLAHGLKLDAVQVLAAIELINGSLLERTDQLARGRGERYREAMVTLLHAIFQGE